VFYVDLRTHRTMERREEQKMREKKGKTGEVGKKYRCINM
jgi:hypothetical protein